jgi:hypothetical protein
MLPIYGKFVSCRVHGRLNCSICMNDTDVFRLQHDKKVSFFNCHRRFLLSNHSFSNDTHPGATSAGEWRTFVWPFFVSKQRRFAQKTRQIHDCLLALVS